MGIIYTALYTSNYDTFYRIRSEWNKEVVKDWTTSYSTGNISCTIIYHSLYKLCEKMGKSRLRVISDGEVLDEAIEDVIEDKPSSLLVRLAMVVLKHSNEVEKMDVKFKSR